MHRFEILNKQINSSKYKSTMIIDVFNKIYNGATSTSVTSSPTNQTSRLMNLTTSATIETPPLHNANNNSKPKCRETEQK